MVEQPVKLMVVSTVIRTTALEVSSTSVVPILLQGVTPPPQMKNTLFNPTVTRPLFGFSIPMNNKDYPYGIATSMMVVTPLYPTYNFNA